MSSTVSTLPAASAETPPAAGRTAPGPRGDMLLGSTLDFRDRPARFIKYVAQAYGDVTRFRVGPTWWYIVTHPEDVQDMMTKRAALFVKPKIAKRMWDKFLGDGVLTSEGEVWKRQHRLMQPAFHRSRIAAYGKTMVDYTHRMLDGWEDGETRDVDAAMVGLTLEIVAKTLFDVDIRGDANTIGTAMTVLEEAMVAHITMPLPVPSWWPSQRNKKKLAAIGAIEEIVRSVIADRRATGEDRGDLLSMLLLARDEDGDQLSDKELRDQSMTLIFAGHETSAHALTWAWYLLGTHPKITARLQADIEAVVGDRRLEVSDLKKLPYLEQVFKESMRLRPSVWVFMKEPTEDVVVRGVKIPKGAQIMISPYVIQRDERWFPSPETFDPDRFSPERVGSIPPGAYVPFSGGQRICIGKTFAMMESRLILGSMVQRLNPKVQEGHRPVHKAELSMHPDGPLPIVVQMR